MGWDASLNTHITSMLNLIVLIIQVGGDMRVNAFVVVCMGWQCYIELTEISICQGKLQWNPIISQQQQWSPIRCQMFRLSFSCWLDLPLICRLWYIINIPNTTI